MLFPTLKKIHHLPKATRTDDQPKNINRYAVVIQGDCRRHTGTVVKFYASRHSLVIFSTWDDNDIDFQIPANVYVQRSKKPLNFGLNNRNLQQFSTYQGILVASKLQCNYILKVRSDMILSFLPISLFIAIIRHSKIKFILPYYRCITASPDYFSSICDYFQFGYITDMIDLWHCNEDDLVCDYRLPRHSNNTSINYNMHYSSECQLYALYADKIFVNPSTHEVYSKHVHLIRNYFCMFPIYFFGVIWFGNNGLRKLIPASEHPWWNFWNYCLDPKIVPADYRKADLFPSLWMRKYLIKISYCFDIFIQMTLLKILSL